MEIKDLQLVFKPGAISSPEGEKHKLKVIFKPGAISSPEGEKHKLKVMFFTAFTLYTQVELTACVIRGKTLNI